MGWMLLLTTVFFLNDAGHSPVLILVITYFLINKQKNHEKDKMGGFGIDTYSRGV